MRSPKLADDTLLQIALRWSPDDEQKVGRLAMRDGVALFEYDPAFLGTGIEISPFTLRTRSGVIEGNRKVVEFEGLHGVFNDSLPDGWGRLLVDRYAAKAKVRFEQLTPLDRLAIVGENGIGALVYRPQTELEGDDRRLELDEIADQVDEVYQGTAEGHLKRLIVLGGSPAGARPKVMFSMTADGSLIDDRAAVARGAEQWLVKFAAKDDPKDIGTIEYAYSLMARAAGIDVPKSRLLDGKKGPYFAIRRFDRNGPERVHVATACGLLEASHRSPSMTYGNLIKLANKLTRDFAQGLKMLRLAAFNALAHNRDDHTKQFSFLMDRQGSWRLAPAYDLTFSSPGTEHATLVGTEGRNPTRRDVLQAALDGGLDQAQAETVIDEVASTIARWSEFADEACLSKKSAQTIAKVLNGICGAAPAPTNDEETSMGMRSS
jgi:serine/threonine-protein kinase HipA